jgi:hypothetical protein
MTNACPVFRFRYPYEEFSGHIKATTMVRQWEYTSHFGFLGAEQSDRLNRARIIDYFSDSYSDWHEALEKAEIFLLICDFIARNSALFAREGFIERPNDGDYVVESALLRAVHHFFTTQAQAGAVEPNEVLGLARTFPAC